MNKSILLRETLANNKIIRLAGAHNGLSARLAQMAGFDAIWASGFEIASSYCVPDANILSMSECLQIADMINKTVDIPVIADCDSGFGDINNVIHLVKSYEDRGIAAICIEDKHFPKINSFVNSGQNLVSIEDFSAKLIAANAAKKNDSFMIIARIEALIAGAGMDEALKRAVAYEKSGADALLIHSKQQKPDEIFNFMRLYKGSLPVFIVPTTYYGTKVTDFIDATIKGVIYANQGIRASVTAVKKTFKNIITQETTAFIEADIATVGELFDLQGMDLHNANYETYAAKAIKITE
ncbi:MAG: phosphoenolpyruvate phosphomutase [Legionella sp.]|nr:MAG: phosphoenolpyruvate phosphomutase [Legionella sp.]